MNWIPNLPTDSLHKYLALHGLWFIYGVLALLVFLQHQNFKHDEFNQKQAWLHSKEEAVRKFKDRIKSISSGKLTENNIPGITDHFTPKDEILFLNNAIVLNKADIDNLAQEVKKQPESLFPFLNYLHIDVILLLVLTAAFIFTSFGFSNWWKLQRISDEIQKHDLELKRIQLLVAKRTSFRRKKP